MLKSVWIVYMFMCHGDGTGNIDNYCAYYTSERPVFSTELKCSGYAKKLRPIPIMTADGYMVTRVECWHAPFVLSK
jgi:hypothetical protein